MRFQQAPSDVLSALQLALDLKRLQVSLYSQGIAAGFVDPPDAGAMSTIQGHEQAHVSSLTAAITARGGTATAEPTWDFSAGGALAGFDFGAGQYPTFVGIAQAVEDLGVRALKGQLTALMADKAALSLFMSIHAVEAQHAARVRAIRAQRGWPRQDSRDTLPAFLQPIYSGEEQWFQLSVNVPALPLSATNGGADAATSAFDEPLGGTEARAIMDLFVAAA